MQQASITFCSAADVDVEPHPGVAVHGDRHQRGQVQHAVHALGGLDQLRQPHHVALHQLQPRVALQMLDVVGRALEEAVEDRHRRRALAQHHLGRRRADQARAARRSGTGCP